MESTSESQGDSASSSSAPTAGRAPTNEIRSEILSVYISLWFSPSVKPGIQRMRSGSVAEDKLRSECYSRVSSHPATSWYFLYIVTSSCLPFSKRWLCKTGDTATSNIQHVWVTFRKSLQHSAALWHTEFRSPALQPTAPEFGIYYHFPLYRKYCRNTVQNILTLTSLKSPRNNAPFVVLPRKMLLDRVVTPHLPRSRTPKHCHLKNKAEAHSCHGLGQSGHQASETPNTQKPFPPQGYNIQISSLPDEHKDQSQWVPDHIRLSSFLCFKLFH